MKKFKLLSVFLTAALLIGMLPVILAVPVTAVNPYLPLWEHLPDGEPHVFEDPDNPGKYRVYIIGSHDVRFSSYCGPDIRAWSAPVEDLTDWRDDGSIFTFQDPKTEKWDVMYAPDMVEVLRRDENGDRTIREYYLYPHSRGPGREAMVAKGTRPDGPFEPINLAENGRNLLPGSVMGFDPAVYIEYVDDPADPDYEIGFRAYGYWGWQGSYAAELDQNTMYSVRPGTERITHFIPTSSAYGKIRDPEGTTYPHVYDDEDLLLFNYFEAFSIRKVGNKYVCIFSGYSGPDYGLGSTNSALRYMFADSPLGPWRIGGVLVDSRAPVLNKDGNALAASYSGHNTHGGIELINDQWYAFYHRAPRSFGYARQPMVAPVHIEWDEKSVADGGRVIIRAYNPYADDYIWTAKASNGTEYTGAEVTSEGFHIYGLDPYQYYSAGIACYLSNTGNQADSFDIWSNHAPLNNVSNGNIIGYKYFDFRETYDKTELNLFLKTNSDKDAKINVWLDGPWDNDAWNGTKIGEINVPVGSAEEITQFSVDVTEFVKDLNKKHAIFLVAEGGAFDLTGLGFSASQKELIRPVPPEVKIMVNGEAIELPETPVRSTDDNGITGYELYKSDAEIPAFLTQIPKITASADNTAVKINITQPEAVFGTAVVEFDFNGAVKTYNIALTPSFTLNLGEPERFIIADSAPVFEGQAKTTSIETVSFMNQGPPPGAVSFTVNVEEAGIYAMSVCHLTSLGTASHTYQMNNGEVFVFDYPEGDDWQESLFPYNLNLNKGENTIKIAYNGGVTQLGWGGLYK
ncbi:MAG: hypothetical protein FWG44_07170, partial [Oscillospiraceae bacterium]|nr:hypothetical protein [Oscillospiraceae bacterium]